jgi:predicted nucleotidyltransferase
MEKGMSCEAILEKIQTLPYLHSFFVVGSNKKENANPHSDLDVVLICREEAFLEQLLFAFQDMLEAQFGILHLSRPSPYHVYAHLHQSTILDANIFPPMVLSFINSEIQRISPNIEKLFYGALTLARRLISKLIKKEFILVPRFLEQMRNLYLFPLLGQISFPFQIDKLEGSLKVFLLKTYAPPLNDQTQQAVAACLELLREVLVNLPDATWKKEAGKKLRELCDESFAESNKLTEQILSSSRAP